MWLFQIKLNCGMLHTSDAINLGLITISQCFYLWHFSPVLWTCSCNNTQLATSRWGKNRVFMLWDAAMQTAHLQTKSKNSPTRMKMFWEGLKMVWKYQLRSFFKPPNVIYLWIKNIHLIASDLFFSLQHSKRVHSYFSAIISKVRERGGGDNILKMNYQTVQNSTGASNSVGKKNLIEENIK